MTTEHSFGGDWTETKLDCLKRYLKSYRIIFTGNRQARHFRTWYVDAFAGTGERSQNHSPVPKVGLFEESYGSEDAKKYRSGSVDIALSLDNPFDKYLFVEKSKSYATQLNEFIKDKHLGVNDRVECVVGDANEKLIKWSNERDWSKERAVVFLDPYGLQVEWNTVQTLGATKGIDLWYLFPLGLGPMRMIPKDGVVPQEWSNRLDSLFGTVEWRDYFFRPPQQSSLFDSPQTLERDVSVETVSAFIKQRLETCFFKAADGMVLYNSKNSPMYLLCFAASNERGSVPALRIAKSILGN
jgi:three-Cys-motif partner protein